MICASLACSLYFQALFSSVHSLYFFLSFCSGISNDIRRGGGKLCHCFHKQVQFSTEFSFTIGKRLRYFRRGWWPSPCAKSAPEGMKVELTEVHKLLLVLKNNYLLQKGANGVCSWKCRRSWCIALVTVVAVECTEVLSHLNSLNAWC